MEIYFPCSEILTRIEDHICKYNSDALILTPGDKDVGGDEPNNSGPLSKFTP